MSEPTLEGEKWHLVPPQKGRLADLFVGEQGAIFHPQFPCSTDVTDPTQHSVAEDAPGRD